MRLTFIVGTGRCGSTMLSDALRHHPEVLSLSEFFSCLSPHAFPAASLDGEEFWRILATPRLKPNTLIRQGAPASEFLYPPDGRFRPGMIPAISLVTLAHLSKEPDLLYDELTRIVPQWPVSEPAQQYRRLFRWLLHRLDRLVVVERSGGSLRFVRQLRELFPEAGFLHLHRSGPDTAVSMSRHPSFRLSVVVSDIRRIIGVDPYHVPSGRHAEALPRDLRQFLPDEFRASALWERHIPIVQFGHLWSGQILQGVVALEDLPRSRRKSMSYEAVLAEPERTLAAVARFAGVGAHDAWLRLAAAEVDPSRPRPAPAVPGAAWASLVRACAPGTRLLNGAGA